ncbi:MAG: hypothetical protein R3A10_10060 [Caldilineaceae bacterium]
MKSNAAWRIVSTDGLGADARVMAVRSSLAMRLSESSSNSASRSTAAWRTGAKPARSMVARSQPLP